MRTVKLVRFYQGVRVARVNDLAAFVNVQLVKVIGRCAAHNILILAVTVKVAHACVVNYVIALVVLDNGDRKIFLIPCDCFSLVNWFRACRLGCACRFVNMNIVSVARLAVCVKVVCRVAYLGNIFVISEYLRIVIRLIRAEITPAYKYSAARRNGCQAAA